LYDGEGFNQNEKTVEEFATIIPFDDASRKQLAKQLEQIPDPTEKSEFLYKIASNLYEKREKDLGKDLARQIEVFAFISVIDNLWTDHLDAIEALREGIGLRGYAQRDPLVEYKNEAFRMFETLMAAIDDETVHRIFKIAVAQSPHSHEHISEHAAGSESVPEISGNKPKEAAKNQNGKKLGRNDPCWCGSGKKWKKCHFPQTSG
jgi:preprotein translocase subunit SecA